MTSKEGVLRQLGVKEVEISGGVSEARAAFVTTLARALSWGFCSATSCRAAQSAAFSLMKREPLR